ncbi:MAG: prepilin-type N-terminal cleavage/methylation domain-containing protein [Thermodesulfobacteriota bacterium]
MGGVCPLNGETAQLKPSKGFLGEICGAGDERPVPHGYKGSLNSRGFTLIELMVVVAILGTMASIAVPAYSSYIDRANTARAIAEIRTLEKEILAYQAANETLPNSLADIGRNGILDPWGNPYEYTDVTTTEGKGNCRKDHFMNPLNSDFDLYSMGKDGKSASPLTSQNSRDDILRANSGAFVGKAEDY